MNNQTNKLPSQQSLKSELIYSIPFSFLVGHIFVSFRQEENLLGIIYKPGYTLAVAVSSIIAFILIIIVRYGTRILDGKLPWDVDKTRRFFLQFFYVFLPALFIEWLMSSAYFLSHGYSLEETIWADSYVLPIGMYILMINGYYNPSALITKPGGLAADPVESVESVESVEIEEVIESVKPRKSLTKDNVTRILNRTVDNDVVFIATSNKKVYARNRKGEHVLWHDTLANTIAALPAEDFFLVHRSCILHRNIIDQLHPDPENHKLTITLKPPFNEKIDVPHDGIRNFEEWWYKKSA